MLEMDDSADHRPDDAAAEDDDPYAGTGIPRWVRVLGIIALVVVVAFIVLMVAGGGEHTPGRHL